MHLHDLTIRKFHQGLLKKEFKALEIAEDYFNLIEDEDRHIGAFLSLSRDTAMKQAEAADIAVAEGKVVGPLAGVPLAIKDNILIKGQYTTAGSKILEKYVAAYDASVIKKLKEQNAVFLGKTNLDEFAMGSSTENSAFSSRGGSASGGKITKNPHDHSRVPGGSSGGSAAAVAANFALGALGSDTGGSIRQPASFCGVVGLKPTYGAVSRFGLIAMASSLDQIGPIGKTVEDAAIMFKEISSEDRYDSTSVPVKYGNELLNPKLEDIKKLRVGLPKEYFGEGIELEVRAGIEEAIKQIKSLGLEFKEISLPHTKYAVSCYYIIMPAEVSANLARYDSVRYGTRDVGHETRKLIELYKNNRSSGFGNEVKRRIILGTFVLSSGYYDAYYSKAQKVRRLIKNDFENAFKEVDVILTPVAPTRAFKIGEKTSDPLAMYLSDIFTIPVNLAGLPALSLPVHFSNPSRIKPNDSRIFEKDSGSFGNHSRELPVGFQLIGKPFREADILGLGQYYERL